MSKSQQVNQHLDAISVHDFLHIAFMQYQLVQEAYQTVSLHLVCTLYQKYQQKYTKSVTRSVTSKTTFLLTPDTVEEQISSYRTPVLYKSVLQKQIMCEGR